MQIEHVILFNKIAEEKSISKVAQANHISQPALSQQMQRLEEEIGLKLLERSNRGVNLTEAGKIMQKFAQQIINTYQNFMEEMDNYRHNSGTFRISATAVAGNYAIPCTLYKLKNEFPSYMFSLSSMPSSEVIRQIKDEQSDIGFIAGEIDEPNIICKKSFSDDIFLVAAKDYNIKESISLNELRKYPLITLNENFSTYRLLLDQVKNLGYDMRDFNVQYHLDSTESVKSLVNAKQGVAFLPYMAIKKEVYQKQLKIIHSDDFKLKYDVSMIYLSRVLSTGESVGTIAKFLEKIVRESIC